MISVCVCARARTSANSSEFDFSSPFSYIIELIWLYISELNVEKVFLCNMCGFQTNYFNFYCVYFSANEHNGENIIFVLLICSGGA
jgi:hypothetical protein